MSNSPSFQPAHDIDADAALADVVGGDEFLGGDQGMKQRRMHGAEHGDALRRAEEPHRPGDGLERMAVEIGIAAIALPARDRQHEIKPGLVGEPRQSETFRPVRRPALRHLRGRARPTSNWRRTARSSAHCRYTWQGGPSSMRGGPARRFSLFAFARIIAGMGGGFKRIGGGRRMGTIVVRASGSKGRRFGAFSNWAIMLY